VVAVGAATFYAVSTGTAGLTGMVGPPPGSVGALQAGQVAVLAVGPLLYLGWRRTRCPPERRTFLILGSVPAVLFLLAELTDPATTGILVMWTVGLSMGMPAVVHAVSLWLFSTVVAGLLRDAETRVGGLALVLLLVGGYFPQSTYELLVTATALALWSDISQMASRPWVSGLPALVAVASGENARADDGGPNDRRLPCEPVTG
jgi:hypothetical protein